jgi:ligand-binding sensor domain-containing protein
VLSVKSGVLAVLALAIPASANALDPAKAVTQYALDAWDTRAGLPNDSVSALAQTRERYLWIGTVEGLGRFDGQRFTRFDSSTPGTLSASYVRALLVDRDGSLWIGTLNGLNRVPEGRVTAFGRPEGLRSEEIRARLASSDGGLWVGTYGGGLHRVDGSLALGARRCATTRGTGSRSRATCATVPTRSSRTASAQNACKRTSPRRPRVRDRDACCR